MATPSNGGPSPTTANIAPIAHNIMTIIPDGTASTQGDLSTDRVALGGGTGTNQIAIGVGVETSEDTVAAKMASRAGVGMIDDIGAVAIMARRAGAEMGFPRSGDAPRTSEAAGRGIQVRFTIDVCLLFAPSFCALRLSVNI